MVGRAVTAWTSFDLSLPEIGRRSASLLTIVPRLGAIQIGGAVNHAARRRLAKAPRVASCLDECRSPPDKSLGLPSDSPIFRADAE